jgi:hypothetical protein
MNPINPLGRLAEILRKRVSNEPSIKGKVTEQQVTKASDGSLRAAPDELRRRISRSIAAIDINDPMRGNKATRIFVEQVLTWQFGDNLLNDPGFTRLVEEVQQTLEQDPGFHDALLATSEHTNP